MTVHEAHKEYNSLIDQIRAKYELLDSGECGSVGTPAFNAVCTTPQNGFSTLPITDMVSSSFTLLLLLHKT